MKKIYVIHSIVTLFLAFTSITLVKSQDYRCIVKDSLLYMNDSREFDGIHIDSSKKFNTDSIVFFHSVLNQRFGNIQIESDGKTPVNAKFINPWIGEKMIISKDSTLFFTDDSAKIVIKQNASIGETWTFFQTIKATIEKIDTITINGMQDSVKIIKLINTNQILTLSKKHGLIEFMKVSDFKGSTFSKYVKSKYMLPSDAFLYNYEPGDIYLRETETNYSQAIKTYNKQDSIISKIQLKTGVKYTIQTKTWTCNYVPYQSSCTKPTTGVETKEYSNQLFSYPYEMPIIAMGSRYYTMKLNSENLIELNYYTACFEYCGSATYREGFGLTHDYSPGHIFDAPSVSTNLMGYRKNGVNYKIATEEIYKEEFSIYPNPVSSGQSIYIVSPENDDYIVSIVDLSGRVISSDEMHLLSGPNNYIVKPGLAQGAYLLTIKGKFGRFVIKLIIQ